MNIPKMIVYNLIVYFAVFIFLLIASISDLKTREVPDWLNFGAILTGLFLNLIFSLITFNFIYFTASIVGFAVFYAIAYVLFYTGQWGGGDSKAMMAMGALIGINLLNLKTLPILAVFFVNSAIIGALYGLLWSICLSISKWGKFKEEFKKRVSSKKLFLYKILILFFGAVIAYLFFSGMDKSFKILYMGLFVAITFTFYLWVYVGAVEKSCMLKLVPINKLTEGDWISMEVIKGKRALFKLKKRKLKNAELKKLNKIVSCIDFAVPIKRRALFLFDKYISVKLSNIKKSDIILREINKKDLKIKNGTKINEEAKDKIMAYFKLNELKDAIVSRKILFFKVNRNVHPSKIKKEDIVLDGIIMQKYICGPKDLGISRFQIELLKKLRIKEVLIKEGVPFVPSFFIAFVISLLIGNIAGLVI